MTVKWEVERNSWIRHPVVLCLSDPVTFTLKDNKVVTMWQTVWKEDTEKWDL